MPDASPGDLVIRTIGQFLRVGAVVLAAAIGVDTALTSANPVLAIIAIPAAFGAILAVSYVYVRFINWYFEDPKPVPWVEDPSE
ncbi:MAG: hypothetical protein ABEJ57_03185 [Halobacteriaceae archaeon]